MQHTRNVKRKQFFFLFITNIPIRKTDQIIRRNGFLTGMITGIAFK